MPCHRSIRITRWVLLLAASAVWLSGFAATADTLELVNGDVYTGTIVSVNRSNLVFQSEIQGLVTLPRDKLASITFRESVATKANGVSPSSAGAARFSLQYTNRSLRSANSAKSAKSVNSTNPPAVRANEVVQQMRQQGVDPKLVSHVQEQILSRASPEASQKFDELLGGLLGGTISIEDIRSQAQSSIKAVQEARGELGSDLGGVLDGYLVILQNFLKETDPAPPTRQATTNAP